MFDMSNSFYKNLTNQLKEQGQLQRILNICPDISYCDDELFKSSYSKVSKSVYEKIFEFFYKENQTLTTSFPTVVVTTQETKSNYFTFIIQWLMMNVLSIVNPTLLKNLPSLSSSRITQQFTYSILFSVLEQLNTDKLLPTHIILTGSNLSLLHFTSTQLAAQYPNIVIDIIAIKLSKIEEELVMPKNIRTFTCLYFPTPSDDKLHNLCYDYYILPKLTFDKNTIFTLLPSTDLNFSEWTIKKILSALNGKSANDNFDKEGLKHIIKEPRGYARKPFYQFKTIALDCDLPTELQQALNQIRSTYEDFTKSKTKSPEQRYILQRFIKTLDEISLFIKSLQKLQNKNQRIELIGPLNDILNNFPYSKESASIFQDALKLSGLHPLKTENIFITLSIYAFFIEGKNQHHRNKQLLPPNLLNDNNSEKINLLISDFELILIDYLKTKEGFEYIANALANNLPLLGMIKDDLPQIEIEGKDLWTAILEKNGCAIQFVSKETNNYEALCDIAEKQTINAIQFISNRNHLKETPENNEMYYIGEENADEDNEQQIFAMKLNNGYFTTFY